MNWIDEGTEGIKDGEWEREKEYVQWVMEEFYGRRRTRMKGNFMGEF